MEEKEIWEKSQKKLFSGDRQKKGRLRQEANSRQHAKSLGERKKSQKKKGEIGGKLRKKLHDLWPKDRDQFGRGREGGS